MTPPKLRSVASAVERQMRNWEIARQQQHEAPPDAEQPVEPFLCVSRTVASGGEEVAQRLAEMVNWPLFDREVLAFMAEDDGVRKRLYETMDERDLSFIEETMRFFTDAEVKRNDYFRRLTETVLALARQGSAIFLGRGADLILPRELGLRVRFTSLPGVAAQRYADTHGMTSVQAVREIDRLEQQRQRFVASHFHVDANAPDRFDLVINLASVTQEEAVRIIHGLLGARGYTT